MPVVLSNVPGRAEPEGFVHIGVATGSKTVYLAGQTAEDAEGEIVAKGDLAGQTEQALLNVAGALDSVGATFDDVAKITLYIVDWEPSKIEAINAGAGAAAGKLGVVPVKPATLIGVAALFDPEHLIEIDATAVMA
jgi:enamine deaminase RidA (YjgF/YER057c/UK114 family)